MTRFARHERAQHADSQIDKINLRIVLERNQDPMDRDLLLHAVCIGVFPCAGKSIFVLHRSRLTLVD